MCDWKDIRSVTALLIVYTLLSSTYQVLKGVAVLVSSLKVGRYQREIRVYGGVEWSVIRRDTGGYWSVAEVIDTHSSAPHTWKESCNRFFGRGLCSFLFPDRESTEEETPIARAVGGSFCYARHLRSVLFCRFVINWALPFC